jgi:hypothetical protein
MSNQAPQIDPREFRDFGYLQEANRLFFHPLGLVLCWSIPGGNSASSAGHFVVLDEREDSRGIWFDGIDLEPKAERVAQEWHNRRAARVEALGYQIQPAGDPTDCDVEAEGTPAPSGEMEWLREQNDGLYQAVLMGGLEQDRLLAEVVRCQSLLRRLATTTEGAPLCMIMCDWCGEYTNCDTLPHLAGCPWAEVIKAVNP